jgi:hypothetical protein
MELHSFAFAISQEELIYDLESSYCIDFQSRAWLVVKIATKVKQREFRMPSFNSTQENFSPKNLFI